jgi:hypothetical protein
VGSRCAGTRSPSAGARPRRTDTLCGVAACSAIASS